MQAILWAIASWFIREVIVKFVVLGGLFFLVQAVVPMVVGYVANWISPTGLTNLFSQIPAGAWFFLDAFRLDVGVPLLISAHISRFLIRRVPVIG